MMHILIIILYTYYLKSKDTFDNLAMQNACIKQSNFSSFNSRKLHVYYIMGCLSPSLQKHPIDETTILVFYNADIMMILLLF